MADALLPSLWFKCVYSGLLAPACFAVPAEIMFIVHNLERKLDRLFCGEFLPVLSGFSLRRISAS